MVTKPCTGLCLAGISSCRSISSEAIGPDIGTPVAPVK